MNACERYEEMISALLDGELDAEAEAELRSHVAECAHCSELYEAFAAVGAALREQDVPDTLHDGIMTKVHAAEKAQKTQNVLIRLRPILAAAACLIVLVGTVFALKNTVGFGRSAMKSAKADAPMAAESAAALNENSIITAGGSAEAPTAADAAPQLADSKLALGTDKSGGTTIEEARDNTDNGAEGAFDTAVSEPAGSIWDTPEFADKMAKDKEWADWMNENDWRSCVMVNGVIYEYSRVPGELFHSDGLPEGCVYYGEVIQRKEVTTPEELWPKADREFSCGTVYRVEGQIYTVPGNADVVYLDIDIYTKVSGELVRSTVVRCDRRS